MCVSVLFHWLALLLKGKIKMIDGKHFRTLLGFSGDDSNALRLRIVFTGYGSIFCNWFGKFFWTFRNSKVMAPHSSTLAWKSPWTEEPGGCSPWGRWELDTTQWLHFHFLLSCIGEGNGNPLQCSRLENPRDGGAWWAALYGVAQSRTWLKWLSSSSSSRNSIKVIIRCWI